MSESGAADFGLAFHKKSSPKFGDSGVIDYPRAGLIGGRENGNGEAF